MQIRSEVLLVDEEAPYAEELVHACEHNYADLDE